MKKIMIIAAAVAALAACSKEAETVVDANHFEKGQKVTLMVKAGEPSTKVSSEPNSSTGGIDFKWEKDDVIKVTVNGQPAEFTLSSGAGEAEATFTGTMPAAGNTFSVQYPSGDTPALSTQTYSGTEALPHDKMLFTAENCELSKMTFELTAQYAALQLNLYGGARSVSQIVVTNTETSDTYTLTCNPAKVVGKDKDNATPFFIIVPAGSGSWTFSAAVTAVAVESTAENTVSYGTSGLGTIFSLASTTFSPAAAQSFSAGSVLNMPAKSLTTVWAPVNCGYDIDHTYGLLYQWGRKYGQAYENSVSPISMAKADDTEENKDKFGKCDPFTFNWFSGTVDNTLWSYNSKGVSDPCPTGWRVPTDAELAALKAHESSWTTNTVGGVSQSGYWFSGGATYSESVPRVFLPAAGYRSGGNGGVGNRGNYGYYWSSSVDGDNALSLYFYDDNADMDGYFSRAEGYSVRCVQE